MDILTILIAVLAVAAIAVALWTALSRRGEPDQIAAQAALQASTQADAHNALIAQLSANQADLAARLELMTKSQGELTRTLEQRFENVSKRLGDGLTEHSQRTGDVIKQVHERLAVIDTAQKNLTDLSDQVVNLQALFSNKQARGAFGEVQLYDIIKDFLPSNIYNFQATLSNGRRPDCLLNLPNPPGPIAIDAKFPLESYRAIYDARDDVATVQAGKQFSADIKKHIKDIADKYIIPGETTDGALMFLPSEAVSAELHTNFMNVVEEAQRRRVYIVSPSTLMGFLNSMRALLKDVHMREQAGLIQTEVKKLMRNVELLDERIAKVRKNFDTAHKEIEKVQTSSDRIKSDVNRVEKIQLDDVDPEALNEPEAVATPHSLFAPEDA